MKPWDIYSWKAPGMEKAHPAVILGTADRVALKPQMNILVCTREKAGRIAQAHETLLDQADGLEWETLCRCDLVYAVEKSQLSNKRGQVIVERRRQMAGKVIQGLGLAGL